MLNAKSFSFFTQAKKEDGIKKFISQISNSYAKYFNTKQERSGHLFEGQFRSVFIEDDEQLIHVSRYIHLNPLLGSLVNDDGLGSYPYSSYSNYISESKDGITLPKSVLDQFNSKDAYKKFVFDHVGYAKKLHELKHKFID